ncbi:unnamed protein product, partial [Gongylonema pulchrum]|uniref:SETD2 methyltransferase n=1 Tax=Gongylonema pulchrum TaxID=637853 RepID=A0A183CYK0_9BILA
ENAKIKKKCKFVSVTKRDNSYGDEPVPPTTEVPLLTESSPQTPAEVVASTVEQPAPSEQPSIESSGYRKKRDNSYGDEPITPAAVSEATGYVLPEEAPVTAEQPLPPVSQPSVESSGYRKKRSNEYGDEPITPQPAPASAPANAYEAPEQAPTPVEQPAPAPYPVESSGY